MMKNTVIILLLFSFAACTNQSETTTNPTGTEDSTDIKSSENKTEVDNSPNKQVEYHPNGQVKIEGKLNENGNRQGLWVAYYDNGIKWSESYYTDGQRDGHSITFHPNGEIRYIGEYKNDEKVGTWKFYNEKGELTQEQNF